MIKGEPLRRREALGGTLPVLVPMALAVLVLVPVLGGLGWYLYARPGPRANLD